jgi:hypothetical protein
VVLHAVPSRPQTTSVFGWAFVIHPYQAGKLDSLVR